MIRLFIVDQGQKFVIPTTAKIIVSGTKSNGTFFSYNTEENPSVVSFEENVVSFTVQKDMTDVFGVSLCGVTIEYDDELVGTQNFEMRIQQGVIPLAIYSEIKSIQS